MSAEAETRDWPDTPAQACGIAIVDIIIKAGSGLGVLQHIAGYERT